MLTTTDWFDRLCASCKRDDGQTMAEYGVVMAVQGAINRVIGIVPG